MILLNLFAAAFFKKRQTIIDNEKAQIYCAERVVVIMDILKAKQLVIEAGERLVETGLIARTWGNVSCRVDDKSFVITPSGKPYIGLKPEDIVQVSIEDLEYTGNVKPSSEKGVHAEVYKAHSDAGFVIHTHQKLASAISVLGLKELKITDEESKKVIGDKIAFGVYGLPGTKKLKNGVTQALESGNSKAIILPHHGAVCFGKDSEEAFLCATTLENVSREYILGKYEKLFGVIVETIEEFSKNLSKYEFSGKKTIAVFGSRCYNSSCVRENNSIEFNSLDGSQKKIVSLTENLSGEEKIHKDIYLARSDINSIIHSVAPEVVAVSSSAKKLEPLLDDFAQLIGPTVKASGEDSASCVSALKGRHAILLENKGALCCGANLGDAQAVEMIMEKSCLAKLSASIFEADEKINFIEAKLMRFVYLKKYSKKAQQ